MRQTLALSFLALAACSGSSSAPSGATAGAGGSGTAGTTSVGGAAGTSASTGGAAGTSASTGGAGGATAGAAGATSTGGAGGAAALNGCNDADFVDGTADAFNRTILFGGTTGTKFSPRCLRIKTGQMVTFSGPFTFHPLAPGSTPTMPDTGSPNNPIMSTTSGMSQAFTFPTAGSFPFLCAVHFATGMVGVVRVE